VAARKQPTALGTKLVKAVKSLTARVSALEQKVGKRKHKARADEDDDLELGGDDEDGDDDDEEDEGLFDLD